jgi:hypothetical protein
MAARITQAMLERAVGGAAQLVQLLDINRTNNPADATFLAMVADVLNEANAEVNSYVFLAADSGDASLQTAPLLIRYELIIATYLAWLKGTSAIAMPPEVETARNNTLIELEKIAARKKGIGLAVRPAASQQVQQVTKKDTEDFFSSKSPRKRFDGWS